MVLKRFMSVGVFANLVLVGSNLLAAEPVVYEPDTWRSLTPHENSSSIVLGDVNQDGSLDLIFGNKVGGATLYLNVPGRLNEGTPAWSSEVLSAPTTALALGDINGDGLVDLVCGSDAGPVSFFANLGGTFSTLPQNLGANLIVSDLVLADLDNDQDLDLVLACDGQPNRWWPNVAGELRSDMEVLLTGNDLTKGVAVGDLNGSGWLDLVVVNDSSNGDLHRVIVNQSGDLTAQAVDIPFQITADKPTSVALGDTDGDGLLDIVFGAQSNRIWVYRHNGDFTFVNNSAPTGAGFPTDVALHDLNADGLLDICYTTASGTLPLNWVENLAGSWAPGVRLLVQNAEGLNALAFGDLDEDGDLDLALASSDSTGNAVAWRLGGTLEAEASWVAQDNTTTYGLAFVDLDQDGDLDVVQGRFGTPNVVYWNDNGLILPTPVNINNDPSFTTSLVVTDWTNNGFPDLIFGEESQPVQMHVNIAGSITASPVLLTEYDRAAWSLRVADLDKNGFDDLIEGSPGRMRISLRDDVGGGFARREIVGVTSLSNWYNYLDLADVDGDGDLDIAAALNNGPDVVLQNDFPDGGTLSTFWSSPVSRYSAFVSLSDLNGDAADDLVFGYAETALANEWYRFDGTDFDVPGRTWGDKTSPTWQVDLTDWDGDGSLDLLEANFDGANSIYQNKAGFIAQEDRPLWAAPVAAQTYRLASGDLDGDGDLDLWVGNRDEPDKLYRGVVNPGPTNPGAPISPYLPFQAAYLRSLKVEPVSENQVQLSCVAVDLESDGLTILARCRPVSSSQWFALESHPDLTTSAPGTAHTLRFDSSTWPVSTDGYVVQLRTLESSSRVAQFRVAPWYEVVVEESGITRPARILSSGQIMIPTVTEGGTASGFLTVANEGNAPLEVTSVTPSRPDMSVLTSLPIQIQPDNDLTLEFLIEPLDTTPDGSIVIATNDPRNPSDTVSVATDIRALEFDFNFLLEAGVLAAPLGESLTGLLAPRDAVDLTAGWLHYRPSGSIDFDSLPFSQVEDDWVVVLPGAQVTEAGIEFYVEVRNGERIVTDPEVDPTLVPRLMPVTPPSQLSTQVQPHSDAGVSAARDVFVRVTPPVGAAIASGQVQYRLVGASEFQVATLQSDSTAIIPAEFVGSRGLEFHVDVMTGSSQLRDPLTGEHQIRVNVPDLSEPEAAPARQYRMVSVPLDFGDFDGSIGDLVSDQSAFGPYDNTRWRCFRYAADLERYTELSESQQAARFQPIPGRAFWLIAAQENRLSSAPVVGRSLPGAAPYRVLLNPGWNQVGNPFAFAVNWADVFITNLAGELVEDMVTTPVSGATEDLTQLNPFGGFWLNNFSDENLYAQFQPFAALDPVALSAKDQAVAWQIKVIASGDDMKPVEVNLGAGSAAQDGWDHLDRLLPPSAPNEKLRLSVINDDWDHYSGHYTQDFRADKSNAIDSGLKGHSWQLAVALTSVAPDNAASIELEFSIPTAMPLDYRAELFDRELQQRILLNPNAPLTVIARRQTQDAAPGRYQLLVGTESYLDQAESTLTEVLPRRTVLMQNAPNPFNPATTLRYELSSSGQVRLKVYDIKGRHIRELVSGHQDLGSYEVLWNGRDSRNEPVGAGVYFARLEAAGSATQTIKMILVN